MLNKESPDGCLPPFFVFGFTWLSISNPSRARFRYEAHLWTRCWRTLHNMEPIFPLFGKFLRAREYCHPQAPH